jgi:hypothetical protein
MISGVKQQFVNLWKFVYLFWRNIYSFSDFCNQVIFLSLSYYSSLYLDINSYQICNLYTFSYLVGCLFTLLVVSFDAQKLSILMKLTSFFPFVTCQI